MLAAHMIGTFLAASWMAAVCSGLRPVVPITIATPLSAAILACATVAAGTVKSITTLAAPMAAGASDTIFTLLAPTPATSPASRPSALLLAPSMAPARLHPSVWSICRISIWPMRPAAPAMAIFISFPCDWLR